MWEFSGYKWNFATISFHDFHRKVFFLLLLLGSEFLLNSFLSFGQIFWQWLGTHSDILHQLFTVTDDVNQFPEWSAVRVASFLCKNAQHHFICDDHDFFFFSSQNFFVLIIVMKNAFEAENYLIYAQSRKGKKTCQVQLLIMEVNISCMIMRVTFLTEHVCKNIH